MLVGRRQIRTLSKACEIIGALHRLEGRGYSEFNKGTFRPAALGLLTECFAVI
jgi:hypothetical protein